MLLIHVKLHVSTPFSLSANDVKITQFTTCYPLLFNFFIAAVHPYVDAEVTSDLSTVRASDVWVFPQYIIINHCLERRYKSDRSNYFNLDWAPHSPPKWPRMPPSYLGYHQRTWRLYTKFELFSNFSLHVRIGSTAKRTFRMIMEELIRCSEQ